MDRPKTTAQWARHVERYLSALSAARVGVWDWDIETGDFYLDPSVKALLGYDDHEIKNDLDVWTQYVHPDDRDFVMKEATAHLEGETPFYLCEHRMMHKDGTVRWVRAQGAVTRDSDGRPLRMVGTDTEITRRRQVEEELECFFALSHDLLCIKSPGGILRRVSPSFERLSGFSKSELIGRSIIDFVHPEDRARTERAIGEHVEGSDVVDCENRLRCRDGSYRTLRWKMTVDTDASRIFAIGRDVTRERALQREVRLAEKVEALTTIVAGVAHLYNSHMMAVLGNAELALAALPPQSDVSGSIESAVAAGRKAAELTKKISAFVGKARRELVDIDLSAWLVLLEDKLRSQLPPRIDLRMDLQQELPATSHDATQLEQVLASLLDNAAEAMVDDCGQIVVSTSAAEYTEDNLAECAFGSQAPPGAYVCLRVRDSGPGVDRETAERVFDPFFSTKRLGRGLGLSLVLGYVHCQRGAIAVEPRPGEGFAVSLLFPVEQRRDL